MSCHKTILDMRLWFRSQRRVFRIKCVCNPFASIHKFPTIPLMSLNNDIMLSYHQKNSRKRVEDLKHLLLYKLRQTGRDANKWTTIDLLTHKHKDLRHHSFVETSDKEYSWWDYQSGWEQPLRFLNKRTSTHRCTLSVTLSRKNTFFIYLFLIFNWTNEDLNETRLTSKKPEKFARRIPYMVIWLIRLCFWFMNNFFISFCIVDAC